MSKDKQIKFYTLDRILKCDAVYNMIIGERSNGKTYSVLKYALENYVKSGGQLAIIRRWETDIRGRRASDMFNAINEDGVVSDLTGGAFDAIKYYSGKFYLARWNEEGDKLLFNYEDVFAYTFALSENEHNKSISYPNITTVLFDEFLTNKYYLQDEFVTFMNTLSTIIRQRTNVKIFMLGNTVNKFCPYFKEMGLCNVSRMTQGKIDIYTYGDSKLTVAVEYCSSLKSKKKNNFYYAFNNPKLHMITSGAWELDIYPHLPCKYKPKDIAFTYFIIFEEEIFQCEIIRLPDIMFTYIHRKTTPLQDDDRDLVYTLDYVPKFNYTRNIYKPISKLQERIAWFYGTDRVYYQDNEVGNVINNYLKLCRQEGRRL